MNCPIWDELYGDYEKAMLQRVEHRKKQWVRGSLSELEALNRDIAWCLQQLREHERMHCCRD